MNYWIRVVNITGLSFIFFFSFPPSCIGLQITESRYYILYAYSYSNIDIFIFIIFNDSLIVSSNFYSSNCLSLSLFYRNLSFILVLHSSQREQTRINVTFMHFCLYNNIYVHMFQIHISVRS